MGCCSGLQPDCRVPSLSTGVVDSHIPAKVRRKRKSDPVLCGIYSFGTLNLFGLRLRKTPRGGSNYGELVAGTIYFKFVCIEDPICDEVNLGGWYIDLDRDRIVARRTLRVERSI